MASSGRPVCLKEGCDGNLHQEFLTAIPRSKAQLFAMIAAGLIAVPLLVAAPGILEYAQGRGSTGGLLFSIFLLIVPPGIGVGLLRYRSRRLSERTEQQRCNKCGSVFQAG